jgi:two-component system, OmpR family, KDP operon response regulator KdpE
VLVCDDDPHMLRALRVVLGQQGFMVLPSGTAAEALALVSSHPPDAAILDLVLPDGDGVGICESIREWSGMPILVLSAVEEEAEKVRALNVGADDYITKPFGPEELVARLNAVLRRAQTDEAEEAVVAFDGLEVDLAAHAVRREGDLIHLTPTEFALLRTLARNRGRLVTHELLLVEVWGPVFADETQVLRVHVANLRRKIERDPAHPRCITTETGIGYRFAA